MKIQIKLLFLLVVGMFFLSTNLFSQRPQAAKDNPVGGQANKSSFKVSGRVKDASTDEYFEYVNVVILRAKDSSLVNGTITDKDGKFSIDAKKGKYLLRLTFIGYKDDYQPLEIKNEDVQLGVIQLNLGTQALEGVEITAERSMMEYQLDKRVINVDKNIVSAGGNATDVLENVPSVTVDQEGNVSLRGSGNVTVLVDGRPSELLGSDLQTVLEQIPSSTIESVEVITNPSAKYNPDGMSGIINIVLKEKGNRGFNGSVTASTGVGINNDL
ncbi:MAG TPA: TonB-dependent receptor plug domain-containing protein, partial [Bacteroidales bacterium]|nr:TonB-dependent receptor plug domain-containing protein [Bacteroidales bacterium]